MKFFTDSSVVNEYLLIKLSDYKKKAPEFFKEYKEVFIDPGVYELTKSTTYSWEKDTDILEFLNSLPENHYFSADYPSDMNLKYSGIFMDK